MEEDAPPELAPMKSPLVGVEYWSLLGFLLLAWHGVLNGVLAVLAWFAFLVACTAQPAVAARAGPMVPKRVRWVWLRALDVAHALDEWMFPACVVALLVVLVAMARPPVSPLLATAAKEEEAAARPASAAEARVLGVPHWHLQCGQLPFLWKREKGRPERPLPSMCVLVDFATGRVAPEFFESMNDLAAAADRGPRPAASLLALVKELSQPWRTATWTAGVHPTVAATEWPALLTINAEVAGDPADVGAPNVNVVWVNYTLREAPGVVRAAWASASGDVAARFASTPRGQWVVPKT